ncbi:MAG: HigA family addiction module antidote protein [Gammaproteobacteria bacterium]|nr:HigA family addiction module antidote protein [Gammaproteobacteria bacterium]MBI5615577.1 HigA family addiction module antidote protein [Gammaproteobacteria bacterium]
MAKRETKAALIPAMPPVHPGAVLREDVLPATGLSVTAAAEGLGVSRQALHAILREAAAVTPAMALRLGKLLGNGPELWLGMQQQYDLHRAAEALHDEIESIETVRAA